MQGKIFLFSLLFRSSHQQLFSQKLHALHCTSTAFCFPTQYSTAFSFDPCQDLCTATCLAFI